jgi:hypothetical protein
LCGVVAVTLPSSPPAALAVAGFPKERKSLVCACADPPPPFRRSQRGKRERRVVVDAPPRAAGGGGWGSCSGGSGTEAKNFLRTAP